jgi:hypothetical protein
MAKGQDGGNVHDLSRDVLLLGEELVALASPN